MNSQQLFCTMLLAMCDDELWLEEWREIAGYPNYQVSNMGRVRSNRLRGSKIDSVSNWKLLNPAIGNQGYRTMKISRDGKAKTVSVHILVLETFVGPCPDGLEACHFNGIRNDNRLCNLRWDTRKNNAHDRRKHGTLIMGERQHLAKLTESQVIEIKCLINEGELSEREIGRRYSVSRGAIQAIAQGVNWKHVTVPLTRKEVNEMTNEYQSYVEDIESWRHGGN